MQNSKASLIIPIMIITVGVGWLLTLYNVIPGVNWIWVLCLGMIGLLIMIFAGIDKVTIVIGPFLLIATLFSLLRQINRIRGELEFPLLVILFGVLMLISRILPLRSPTWLLDEDDPGIT